VVLLIIHGLLHLVGFTNLLKIASTAQFTGKTIVALPAFATKANGMLWLISCLLFIVAAVFYIQHDQSWWMFGLIALIISQLLIVVYWKDARAGTIVNIIVLLAVVTGYGAWAFNNNVRNDIEAVLPPTKLPATVVTQPMLDKLPPTVQQWLLRANVVGKPVIHTVYLTQEAQMRTKPGGKWMASKASQYFNADNPGFVWTVKMDAAPFVNIVGRDKYENGKGDMLIKALSIIPIAHATGAETDQGTLLRYLAEMAWFPSAALNDYVQWEQVNDSCAKATMTYGGVSATGLYCFSTQGDVTAFKAKRYMVSNKVSQLEDWQIDVDPKGYKTFEGIRIPATSTVTWKLKEGDFTWLKLSITSLRYNIDRPDFTAGN
jgi:hypothetical protein